MDYLLNKTMNFTFVFQANLMNKEKSIQVPCNTTYSQTNLKKNLTISFATICIIISSNHSMITCQNNRLETSTALKSIRNRVTPTVTKLANQIFFNLTSNINKSLSTPV